MNVDPNAMNVDPHHCIAVSCNCYVDTVITCNILAYFSSCCSPRLNASLLNAISISPLRASIALLALFLASKAPEFRLWCGSAFYSNSDPDPDPAFYSIVDPDSALTLYWTARPLAAVVCLGLSPRFFPLAGLFTVLVRIFARGVFALLHVRERGKERKFWTNKWNLRRLK